MKRILLLALLLLLPVSVLAADKFVSVDYGFACNFPGAPAETKDSGVTRFTAYDDKHVLFAQVQIIEQDLSEIKDNDMDAALDMVVNAMAQALSATPTSNDHVKFHGLPAAKVTIKFKAPDGRTFDMAMLIVLVKAKNRVYAADTGVVATDDHSGMQPFLDSFEIR